MTTITAVSIVNNEESHYHKNISIINNQVYCHFELNIFPFAKLINKYSYGLMLLTINVKFARDKLILVYFHTDSH